MDQKLRSELEARIQQLLEANTVGRSSVVDPQRCGSGS